MAVNARIVLSLAKSVCIVTVVAVLFGVSARIELHLSILLNVAGYAGGFGSRFSLGEINLQRVVWIVARDAAFNLEVVIIFRGMAHGTLGYAVFACRGVLQVAFRTAYVRVRGTMLVHVLDFGPVTLDTVRVGKRSIRALFSGCDSIHRESYAKCKQD